MVWENCLAVLATWGTNALSTCKTWHFRNLEVLDASFCGLTELPREFALLQNLLELNLGTNQLKSLPSSFGALSRIVSLNVADNQLRDFPVSMGYLQCLTTLNIAGTNCSSLMLYSALLFDLAYLVCVLLVLSSHRTTSLLTVRNFFCLTVEDSPL